MKFTEEKLENAFIELLGQEGYTHHLGHFLGFYVQTFYISAEPLKRLRAKSYIFLGCV